MVRPDTIIENANKVLGWLRKDRRSFDINSLLDATGLSEVDAIRILEILEETGAVKLSTRPGKWYKVESLPAASITVNDVLKSGRFELIDKKTRALEKQQHAERRAEVDELREKNRGLLEEKSSLLADIQSVKETGKTWEERRRDSQA